MFDFTRLGEERARTKLMAEIALLVTACAQNTRSEMFSTARGAAAFGINAVNATLWTATVEGLLCCQE